MCEDRPIPPHQQGVEHILGNTRTRLVGELDEDVAAVGEAVGVARRALLEELHRRAVELDLGAEVDGDLDARLVCGALQRLYPLLQVHPVGDDSLAVDVRRGDDVADAGCFGQAQHLERHLQRFGAVVDAV